MKREYPLISKLGASCRLRSGSSHGLAVESLPGMSTRSWRLLVHLIMLRSCKIVRCAATIMQYIRLESTFLVDNAAGSPMSMGHAASLVPPVRPAHPSIDVTLASLSLPHTLTHTRGMPQHASAAPVRSRGQGGHCRGFQGNLTPASSEQACGPTGHLQRHARSTLAQERQWDDDDAAAAAAAADDDDDDDDDDADGAVGANRPLGT
nr:hypothetical protein CFP56_03667 [Quercus suber]